ncbi:MAG: GNAT family N-acetyltransferase [Pseudomonadota bacterium]
MHLPQPPLQIERLTLRPYRLADAAMVHAALDLDTEMWRCDPGHRRRLAEWEDVIRRFRPWRRQFGFGLRGAFCREPRNLICRGGLSPYHYERRDGSRAVGCEVMLKVASAYWRQADAAEIAGLWVRFAFERVRFPRIVTCPDRQVRALIGVLPKLGFDFIDNWLGSRTLIGIVENAWQSARSMELVE